MAQCKRPVIADAFEPDHNSTTTAAAVGKSVHGLSWAILGVAARTLALGGAACDDARGAYQPDVSVVQEASVLQGQVPLDGNAVPKFVDPLPTFNGRRANATATLSINMQEFQQKILPASVYARLPAPYNAGTFLWGYNINNTGPSWPAPFCGRKRSGVGLSKSTSSRSFFPSPSTSTICTAFGVPE